MDPCGFRIRERIGASSTAQVYRAERDDIGMVALKVWHDWHSPNNHDKEAHEARALIARGIQHENLAKVLDHGYFFEFLPYIAEELVSGQALSSIWQSLSLTDSVDVLRKVVSAVGTIHSAKSIHGTLRSTKVLISRPPPGEGPYRNVEHRAVKVVGVLGRPALRAPMTGPSPIPSVIEPLRGADVGRTSPPSLSAGTSPSPRT